MDNARNVDSILERNPFSYLGTQYFEILVRKRETENKEMRAVLIFVFNICTLHQNGNIKCLKYSNN